MATRFRKTIKIMPGVKVNVGKHGVSTSVGIKGLHYTFKPDGSITRSASLAGTGISSVDTIKKVGTCKRCGSKTTWQDKYGYCEACHDQLYVKQMQKRAGREGEPAGILYEQHGPVKVAVCRICGRSGIKAGIDKRTGYCKKCTAELEGN